MKESIREKIALIFLVALIVAAGFAIVSYFAFGRSWSVSATLVDDSVGRMNGYSVLVYQAEEDALTNNQYYLKSSNDASIDDRTALDLDMNIYDENRRTIATDTIGLKIMSFYPLVNPWGLSKVNMNDVVALYEDKGADVELLDVSEYGIDSSPKIIKIGDKKIGVFYAIGYKSNFQISKIINSLRKDGAEAIVCITPRLSTLQSTHGLNAVLISEIDDELAKETIRDGDVVITALPRNGKVGVLLFSDNNVATARVIDTL